MLHAAFCLLHYFELFMIILTRTLTTTRGNTPHQPKLILKILYISLKEKKNNNNK